MKKWRLAKHNDFSKDFRSRNHAISATEVPGGWCVHWSNYAGGICFVPFPVKYIYTESE